MFLEWLALSGILKILGQRGLAGYSVPSRDVLGMACVTRDSQDTWTEGSSYIAAYGISSRDGLGMDSVAQDSLSLE